MALAARYCEIRDVRSRQHHLALGHAEDAGGEVKAGMNPCYRVIEPARGELIEKNLRIIEGPESMAR